MRRRQGDVRRARRQLGHRDSHLFLPEIRQRWDAIRRTPGRASRPAERGEIGDCLLCIEHRGSRPSPPKAGQPAQRAVRASPRSVRYGPAPAACGTGQPPQGAVRPSPRSVRYGPARAAGGILVATGVSPWARVRECRSPRRGRHVTTRPCTCRPLRGLVGFVTPAVHGLAPVATTRPPPAGATTMFYTEQ